jgi:hypothetical protein
LASHNDKFTKEDEIQAFKNAGICDPESYDDRMSECHCGIFFEKSDTTYKEWKDAKDWLFRGTGKRDESVVDADPIFRLSPQHSFSDLVVRPVDDENHHIYLPGHEKPIEVNRQNLHMQDKTWTILNAGVRNNGKLLTRLGSCSDKEWKTYIRQISRIRKALRVAFDTNEDPFLAYNNLVGYQLKLQTPTTTDRCINWTEGASNRNIEDRPDPNGEPLPARKKNY